MPKKSVTPKKAKQTKVAKAKKSAAAVKTVDTPGELRGWHQIAGYLGHPAAVVQRWAGEGMPVRRQGRFVVTTPAELDAWLGGESGRPVHVATGSTDLAAELKRGLSFIRSEKAAKAKKR